MNGQTAQDLRSLVARRVGLKRRVAVLASDVALVRALEANGCVVLGDPDSMEALAAFGPEVIVAFDGLLQEEGAAALKRLAAAGGDAKLVLSFANAASASGLLGALLGGAQAEALPEAEVRRWLAGAGYAVTARDVVVTAHRPTGLSADTEASLRALLEQVNPAAAADRLLLVAGRGGAEATRPDRTPGLVSVVVSAGADSRAALDDTLASLLVQQQRPLEVVVVAALAPDALEAAVARARLKGGVTVVTLANASADPAARTNAGLLHAQGQYLAFVEAGVRFSPTHLGSLVRRLDAGTAAWAIAPSARPGAPEDARPGAFSLAGFVHGGFVHRAEWLLDTARLGPFPITFAEGTDAAELALFVRLALLFPPSWQAGPATVERLEAPGPEVAVLLEQLRGRPLRGLATLESLLELPPPPRLAELVTTRVGEVSPRAEALLREAGSVAKKVRRAWAEARKSAAEELEGPPDGTSGKD